MIVALLLAIPAVAFAVLRGGSLDRLATTQFRWWWLLAIGLGAQIGVEMWAPDSLGAGGRLAVLLGSNALVAIFLAANHRLPGMIFAAVGLVLNVIVISANGAMPVSTRALESTGFEERIDDLGAKHELLDDDTRLPWLADVIPLPFIRTIISLGDVVLGLGIARLAYSQTREETGGKHSYRRATTPEEPRA